MRPGIRLLFVLGSFGLGSNAQAQDSTCVTVRDRKAGHVIASALIRIADSVSTREVWTNGAGRVCWPLGAIGNSARMQTGALRYQGVRRELQARESVEVSLERAISGGDDEWRREQMTIALALAIRDVRRCASVVTASCARSYVADVATPAELSLADSVASAEARARLRTVGIAFLESVASRLHRSRDNPQLLSEPSGITLATFVDIPDSAAHYTEFRVAIPFETGRASFGATEMICKATDCNRHRQISLTWNVNADGEFAPSLAIATDGQSRIVDAFDLGASTHSVAAAPRPREPTTARRMSIVRGVVRDENGRALGEAQMLASPDGNDTRSDSTGRFLIQVAAGGGGTVLTVRALGYAPAFRTVRTTADSVFLWEPRLRSVQMLAERVVRETGLPQELSSWRYDEMMARRARGTGYFMIGQEIWSSFAIGDALARVPGVRVKMRYGHTIDNIVMPRCSMQKTSATAIAPGSKIGVFVNGFEQTQNQEAEDVLGEFTAVSVVAIEVYRGMSEIPGEFASSRYCGVISVWTR